MCIRDRDYAIKMLRDGEEGGKGRRGRMLRNDILFILNCLEVILSTLGIVTSVIVKN